MNVNNSISLGLSVKEINDLAELFSLHIVPLRSGNLSDEGKNVKCTETYQIYLEYSNKDCSKELRNTIKILLEKHCSSVEIKLINYISFICNYFNNDYFNMFIIESYNPKITLLNNSNVYKASDKGLIIMETESSSIKNENGLNRSFTYRPRKKTFKGENEFISQLNSIIKIDDDMMRINIKELIPDEINMMAIFGTYPLKLSSKMFPSKEKREIENFILNKIQMLIDSNLVIDLKPAKSKNANVVKGKILLTEQYEHNYKDKFILYIIKGLIGLENLKFKEKKKGIGFTYFLFELLSLIKWEPSYSDARKADSNITEKNYSDFIKSRYRTIVNKRKNKIKQEEKKAVKGKK